ncbi:MAG: FAD-dependent oxidoreductase [Thermodesulfobacteriota bacterium]
MRSVEKARKRIMRRDSAKRATVTEKKSFEVLPQSIPAKDIKKTISAEVVVAGAGISGLTAALSAAEAGAKTILLERDLPTTSVAFITPLSPAGCRNKRGLRQTRIRSYPRSWSSDHTGVTNSWSNYGLTIAAKSWTGFWIWQMRQR